MTPGLDKCAVKQTAWKQRNRHALFSPLNICHFNVVIAFDCETKSKHFAHKALCILIPVNIHVIREALISFLLPF